MALVDEYNYCYSTVAAIPAITDKNDINYLDSTNADDIKILDNISNNILPGIQNLYNNTSSQLTSYYNNIQTNMMNKVSGNATLSDYRNTVASSCSFVKDLRNGVIFARIKSFVKQIITNGIRTVVNGLMKSITDAANDLGLMSAITDLENLCSQIISSLGLCTGMLSQGQSFLNATLQCMQDTSLYNPVLAAGITQVQNILNSNGGKNIKMTSAISSIKNSLVQSTNFTSQANNLVNKLSNASYKSLGL